MLQPFSIAFHSSNFCEWARIFNKVIFQAHSGERAGRSDGITSGFSRTGSGPVFGRNTSWDCKEGQSGEKPHPTWGRVISFCPLNQTPSAGPQLRRWRPSPTLRMVSYVLSWQAQWWQGHKERCQQDSVAVADRRRIGRSWQRMFMLTVFWICVLHILIVYVLKYCMSSWSVG